ncbi:TPA: hypothetical protein ACX6R1_000754 [Photobacterium damselae]
MDDLSLLLKSLLQPLLSVLEAESALVNTSYPNLLIDFGAELAVGTAYIDCYQIEPRLELFVRELPKSLLYWLWWNSPCSEGITSAKNISEFNDWHEKVNDDEIFSGVEHLLITALRPMAYHAFVEYCNTPRKEKEPTIESHLASDIVQTIRQTVDGYFDQPSWTYIGDEINKLRLSAEVKHDLKPILTLVAQEAVHAILCGFAGDIAIGSSPKQKYHILTRDGSQIGSMGDYLIEEFDKEDDPKPVSY